MEISGINHKQTKFSTGAVRDIQTDKGRCDLIPLTVAGRLYDIFPQMIYKYKSYSISISPTSLINNILKNIDNYLYNGVTDSLLYAICNFIIYKTGECGKVTDMSFNEMNKLISENLIEVSIHFKNGLEKYGERNWEKGIPLHSFIDSGVRHLLKYLSGYTDERHDRAFIWNLLCCIYTNDRIAISELNDIPYYNTEQNISDVNSN